MYKSAELRHDITVETSKILIDCLTVNLEIVSQYRNNNQHFAWSSCALQPFFLGGGKGVLICGWVLVNFSLTQCERLFKKFLF